MMLHLSIGEVSLLHGLPKDKADAYRSVIAKMYDTSEWEEVRVEMDG